MFKVRLVAKIRHARQAVMPGKSGGRALSLCVTPWRSLYNWEGGVNVDEILGYSKGASWARFSTPTWPHFDRFPQVCWSLLSLGCFTRQRSKLGHCKHLPSNLRKGISTPGNIESNFSVRGLMWPAKNGTSKSSWICLLPKYQGELETMQRHLDWRDRSY